MNARSKKSTWEAGVTGTEAGALGTGRPPTREVPAAGPRPGGNGRRPRFTMPGRRTVLITLVALTLVAAASTWALYGSSWFRATRVTVTGTGELTSQQIERAARVPLGGPLVSVDTGAVRKRLLAALPRLREVSVSRSWPHTVVVKVTERTPSAVLRTGSRYTEVDRGGVRFATVDHAPAGVPVVQLTPDRAQAAASLRQFGTQRLLQAAITVAGDLPDALRGHATAIRVRSYDGITVELSGHREVVWGSDEDGPLKSGVLAALMKAEPDADRYDVSAPTAPAASGG